MSFKNNKNKSEINSDIIEKNDSSEEFIMYNNFIKSITLISQLNDENLFELQKMDFTKKEISYRDSSLMTLLHYSAISGHYPYFQFLIDKGYDINRRDITQPCIFYLIDYHYLEFFKDVLKHNHSIIDIYNKDCFKDDLFLYSCKKNKGYLFITYILKYFSHYNIHSLDNQNSNGLLLASKVKLSSNKKYLIELGLNPFFKNDKSECAWDYFDNYDKEYYWQNKSINEKKLILSLENEEEETTSKKRI